MLNAEWMLNSIKFLFKYIRYVLVYAPFLVGVPEEESRDKKINSKERKPEWLDPGPISRVMLFSKYVGTLLHL